MPGPPKPPPPKPPPPKPPSPRRSSMLLLSSPSICMAASPWSNYSGGDESDRRHLEHQFGPPADRQRRTLPEVAQARRALPAGDQVPGRILPAPGHSRRWATAPAGAGHEILQRRRHPLEGAVHRHQRSIIAAARRIAGTSKPPSMSAAIPSCSTISTSRPAATFPTPRRTRSSRTSSPSTARWPTGTPSTGPSRAPQGPAPHRRRRPQRGAARA